MPNLLSLYTKIVKEVCKFKVMLEIKVKAKKCAFIVRLKLSPQNSLCLLALTLKVLVFWSLTAATKYN